MKFVYQEEKSEIFGLQKKIVTYDDGGKIIKTYESARGYLYLYCSLLTKRQDYEYDDDDSLLGKHLEFRKTGKPDQNEYFYGEANLSENSNSSIITEDTLSVFGSETKHSKVNIVINRSNSTEYGRKYPEESFMQFSFTNKDFEFNTTEGFELYIYLSEKIFNDLAESIDKNKLKQILFVTKKKFFLGLYETERILAWDGSAMKFDGGIAEIEGLPEEKGYGNMQHINIHSISLDYFTEFTMPIPDDPYEDISVIKNELREQIKSNKVLLLILFLVLIYTLFVK